MRPRPRPPARPPLALRGRATRAAWWISSTCSMPSGRSSRTRTAWRSPAPMPRPASLRFIRRSAEAGRGRRSHGLSARPGAKPLIRGQRQRSTRRAAQPGADLALASPAPVPALSLKIEPAVDPDRLGRRQGRLSALRQPRKARAEMNADIALLEPEAESWPCAEELQRINESLQARERLLTASARASRLLLETPDVSSAIPAVLGLIGEAASADRVSLMQTRTGAQGEPLLVRTSEWTAEGV